MSLPPSCVSAALLALPGTGFQEGLEPGSVELDAPVSVAGQPIRDDLVVADDRVWRIVGDEQFELACTLPDGPGTIHARARHPGGTDFFAAENGLFSLSDDVDHLDPIELIDGAPSGALIGVVIQDHDRIWLATREAFGCVNSRFFFGRTLTTGDGLPAPPYLGLGTDADGALLLATENGSFRYEAGRARRPTARVLAVNGQPYEEGRRYDVEASGAFGIELDGEGVGGVTFRYRAEHHHLWIPLAPGSARVEGLEPGDHTILVTAWDRELRRSEHVAIPVRVAYPKAFDKRLLVPLALGVAATILFGFLLRARLNGGGGLRYAKAGLSAFLTVAVGLQLLVAVIPHGRSWPFVGFTMYLERYIEGSVTYKMTLSLVMRDGQRLQIEPYGAGYGLYEFRRTLAEVMHAGESDRRVFLESLQGRYSGRAVVGFLILDERRRLTPDGPVSVAPTVMCVYPRSLLDEDR